MGQRLFPPRSEWVPRIFRRDGIFYVIDLPEDDDLAEHARLNPGTRQIEAVDGNILWKEEGICHAREHLCGGNDRSHRDHRQGN